MANIKTISSKYIPQYVGNVNEEVGTLLKDYQTRQNKVLDAANELDDSFSIASSQLDESDRKGFEQYTQGIKNNLKSYTDSEYVGNLDRKIVNQGNQFKNIYKVFHDNSEKKRKFVEDISKSNLPEEEQQKYLQLANTKNGSLQYDPISGSVSNRFSPIEVIKNPDINKMINLLDGQIATKEGTVYLSNNGDGKISPIETDVYNIKKEYKQKIIDNKTISDINSKLLNDPEYRQYYERQLELGGKDGKKYAEEKHKQVLNSIVAGLKVGEFNNETYGLGEIADYKIKNDIQESSKKQEKERESKEADLVGNFALPIPINQKMHNAEHIADLNSMTLEAQEKGDSKFRDISAYTKRIEDKYGIKYGKDYEQFSVLGVKKLRILNDSKKHLVEQANADIQKDAMNTTSYTRSFVFNKEAENKIMDRNFQQILGNLTEKNMVKDDKHRALYTPMDIETNEPLTIKQMSNLKNAQFGDILVTSHGVYYRGRSNGSSKEQDEGGSTDSDFNFMIKVPHGAKVLDTLEQLGKVTKGEKSAYEKLQGLDDNFGNYKQIDVKGSKLLVKKVLPSEGGNGYIVKNSAGTRKVESFEALTSFLGELEQK